jgi:hypothetical protein
MAFGEHESKGGKEMIRINLLPERPEAEIWRRLEKALWIFWFSLPLAIFLWAKLAPVSR